ncbi:MAG: hypothetical protein Q7T25_09770 [Sideroxyarcus sp.]|nr:hypothetical protein [Sideroxyarcus sp.]
MNWVISALGGLEFMVRIDDGVNEMVAVGVYAQIGAKSRHGTFGGDGNFGDDAVSRTPVVKGITALELEGMFCRFERQIGLDLGGALEVILVLVPFPKSWQHGCWGKHAQHQGKVEGPGIKQARQSHMRAARLWARFDSGQIHRDGADVSANDFADFRHFTDHVSLAVQPAGQHSSKRQFAAMVMDWRSNGQCAIGRFVQHVNFLGPGSKPGPKRIVDAGPVHGQIPVLTQLTQESRTMRQYAELFAAEQIHLSHQNMQMRAEIVFV